MIDTRPIPPEELSIVFVPILGKRGHTASKPVVLLHDGILEIGIPDTGVIGNIVRGDRVRPYLIS